MRTTRQDGFSLIELMVAMLVTLLVSGAVFALMTAGQGSFRREPALTDRQQNIRVAMDMIQRDIATAGAGMERWIQALTLGDGLGETAPFLNGLDRMAGMATPSGQPRDALQLIGTIDCPAVPIDHTMGVNIFTGIGFPSCYPEPGLVAVTFGPPGGPPTATNWGMEFNLHSGDNRQVNFPGGQQPPRSEIRGPHDVEGAIAVIPLQMVRYEIAPDAEGVPGLWRSSLGGYDADGNLVPAPDPAGGWQLVARGIEDMQVRYMPADLSGFANGPRRVVDGDYSTITREVEVALWGRAIGPRLQGETNPNGAPTAVRGSLVSVTAPRAALQALRDPAAGGFQWR